MLLSALALAIFVSIDALGIGITYGMRNTNISNIAKAILFIIAILVTSISISIGLAINQILPEYIAGYVASILLIIMGIWILYQSVQKKDDNLNKKSISQKKKVYSFFIKFLGITIQIIRNPISSDLDNSKKIDPKEALFLGLALSLDAICVGISVSIMGINGILFSLLVASFQLIFLSVGKSLGNKLLTLLCIPNSFWGVLSGTALILIGICRIFM